MTVPPEFTAHPQGKTSMQGSSVAFSTDANGVPEPTFSWTKDGSAVTADNRISFSADNKQLSLTNVNKTDSGVYRCVATNNVGTVKSIAATLTVPCKKTFTHFLRKPNRVALNPFKFLSPLLSWIISVTPYGHCLSKKGTCWVPFKLDYLSLLFYSESKKLYNARKHICYSRGPCVFPYSSQYLYMRSVYICYSSKASFLWSWTSVQSTAKVNTNTVYQYIDCAYRTSRYHIHL